MSSADAPRPWTMIMAARACSRGTPAARKGWPSWGPDDPCVVLISPPARPAMEPSGAEGDARWRPDPVPATEGAGDVTRGRQFSHRWKNRVGRWRPRREHRPVRGSRWNGSTADPSPVSGRHRPFEASPAIPAARRRPAPARRRDERSRLIVVPSGRHGPRRHRRVPARRPSQMRSGVVRPRSRAA